MTGFPMAVVLAAFYWAMAVSGETGTSPTFDEVAHLTAGYSYWLTDDYRFHPENGVLPQRWAALPLLFGEYRFPSLDQPAWRAGDVWVVGDQFFHQLGNPLESMLLHGRAMIAIAGAALGLLVYAWSRSLFGPAGGMLSLLFYVFCPNMLAHGSLMTSDLMLSLTLTASVWCFWTMLHRISAFTVLRSSLVMALLFVSKMSAIIVLPMCLALLVVRLLSERRALPADGSAQEANSARLRPATAGGMVIVHAVVIVAVVWSCYGFRYSMFGPVRHQDDRTTYDWNVVLADSAPIGPLVQMARDYRLFPEAILYGFSSALYRNKTRASFLNGAYSMTGWWYFFPYSVLVKTPLPLFLVLALAAAGAARRNPEDAARQSGPPGFTIGHGLYRTAPLWILLSVYWAVALGSNLNIGHRHILPTYPAVYILAGAAACWFNAPRRIAAGAALAACLLWFSVESLTIRPHYLAYFNQLAGGPPHAYRHLVDSSLDWGQDLPGLKRWLDRHQLSGQAGTPVYLSYFGSGSPDHYRIAARPLPSHFPRNPDVFFRFTGGVYCVSATMLQSLYLDAKGPWSNFYEEVYRVVLADVEQYLGTSGDLRARLRLEQEKGRQFWATRFRQYEQLRFARLVSYLRQREPDDNVGYSILIYRLSDAQIDEALHGPLAELQAAGRS